MRTVVDPLTLPSQPPPRAARALPILAAILFVYFVIAVAVSFTKVPICDEGWYADPAVNLVQHGTMGSPVIESAGDFLQGIEHRTYWIMPVHILTQAAWYRVAGATLFSMRMISVLAGLATLACWFFLVRTITNRPGLAVLTTGFAAIDTSFLMLAGTGRSDMLSIAFGAAAQASYAALRTRRLGLATLLAHSLVAAAGLTHPIGGLVSFAALVCLQLLFDRERIRAAIVGIAWLPYLAGAIAWGSYIVQSPTAFLAQFGGNSGERLWPWKAPLLAIRREIVERYIGGYTMGSAYSRAADVRMLILAACLAAIVALAWNRTLRGRKLGTLVLLQSGCTAGILLLFEGAKQPWYLAHLVFPFSASLALCVAWFWNQKRSYRAWLAIGVAGTAALQLAYPALLVLQNKYHRSYIPAIAAIGNCPGPCVMGTAELGFGLGFDRVLDDERLGYLTGKRFEYIVLDPRYRSYIEQSREERPDLFRYFTQFVNREYRESYDNGYYTIYQRKPPQQ